MRVDHEIGRMVLMDRYTRTAVDEGVPFRASDSPFWLPAPRQLIWRYADLWKVKRLLTDGEMYLRRSDKLDDDMEGRYATANRVVATTIEENFNRHYNIVSDFDAMSASNNIQRRMIFLACWRMATREDRFMWDTFTKSSDAVAIVTTAAGLYNCLGEGVWISGVNYRSECEPVPTHHSLGPYVFKLRDFWREQELRVLSQGVAEAGIVHRLQNTRMIIRVVTHPRCSSRFSQKVRDLCRNTIPWAEVVRSSLF